MDRVCYQNIVLLRRTFHLWSCCSFFNYRLLTVYLSGNLLAMISDNTKIKFIILYCLCVVLRWEAAGMSSEPAGQTDWTKSGKWLQVLLFSIQTTRSQRHWGTAPVSFPNLSLFEIANQKWQARFSRMNLIWYPRTEITFLRFCIYRIMKMYFLCDWSSSSLVTNKDRMKQYWLYDIHMKKFVCYDENLFMICFLIWNDKPSTNFIYYTIAHNNCAWLAISN